MSTTTIVIIVVAAAVIILVLRRMSESRPQDPMAEYEANLKPASPQAPDVRHIADLITQGRKIEAIKAYRDATGVGLEEAKNAVEHYQPLMERMGIAPVVNLPDWAEQDWAEIDALLEAGNKIEAIKLYRQKTGCDLKEAKNAIDIRDDV
ncbi:MAG TPA: ribosomal protein L7/L12 [Terriglobales bacterium]|nr:ribosomal protein L7/L12 [Terriglobales bacterium]